MGKEREKEGGREREEGRDEGRRNKSNAQSVLDKSYK
jgi:hypothetical protein